MKRRAFFATLAAGLAAAADPERLLWTPGKKLISIPKPAPVTFLDVYRKCKRLAPLGGKVSLSHAEMLALSGAHSLFSGAEARPSWTVFVSPGESPSIRSPFIYTGANEATALEIYPRPGFSREERT